MFVAQGGPSGGSRVDPVSGSTLGAVGEVNEGDMGEEGEVRVGERVVRVGFGHIAVSEI